MTEPRTSADMSSLFPVPTTFFQPQCDSNHDSKLLKYLIDRKRMGRWLNLLCKHWQVFLSLNLKTWTWIAGSSLSRKTPLVPVQESKKSTHVQHSGEAKEEMLQKISEIWLLIVPVIGPRLVENVPGEVQILGTSPDGLVTFCSDGGTIWWKISDFFTNSRNFILKVIWRLFK